VVAHFYALDEYLTTFSSSPLFCQEIWKGMIGISEVHGTNKHCSGVGGVDLIDTVDT
jgi:hypothetical protein